MEATHFYDRAKTRYERIVPIRGRSEDIRPIGKRWRDWGRVVRKVAGDTVSYAYRLRNTDVLEFFPDGRIVVRTDGWETQSTVKFINNTESPLMAQLQYDKLWVRNCYSGGWARPVPRDVGLEFVTTLTLTSNGQSREFRWVPKAGQALYQRRVDRKEAARLRQPVEEFLEYACTVLTLCDYRLNGDTIDEARNYAEHLFSVSNRLRDGVLYEFLSTDRTPEGMQAALCAFAMRFGDMVNWSTKTRWLGFERLKLAVYEVCKRPEAFRYFDISDTPLDGPKQHVYFAIPESHKHLTK